MANQICIPTMSEEVRAVYDMKVETKLQEAVSKQEETLRCLCTLIDCEDTEEFIKVYIEEFKISFRIGFAEGWTESETEIIESLKAYGMSDEQIKEALSLNKGS